MILWVDNRKNISTCVNLDRYLVIYNLNGYCEDYKGLIWGGLWMDKICEMLRG